MSPRYRELSERYVFPLGYQGNNLLCSNWNTENLEALDYNGMFEYLYKMKYNESIDIINYSNNIPAAEFESVIMEYLPVTAKQLRAWAVYDDKQKTYQWSKLGCQNFAPTYFGTSLPEVTDAVKHDDGTVTLTVEAVCDTVICEDAVITHKLTIRKLEDGRYWYLRNEIQNNGIKNIPKYQYRFK